MQVNGRMMQLASIVVVSTPLRRVLLSSLQKHIYLLDLAFPLP